MFTNLDNVESWRSFLPSLTITSSSSSSSSSSPQPPPPSATILNDLKEDGFSLSAPVHPNTALLQKLREAIQYLHDNNLPPSFIALYDECFELADFYKGNVFHGTKNHFNFDILAWCIDPSKSECGFSPHRDRQPPNSQIKASFHENGLAKYVTCWTALSPATPDNSCLYVIPKPHDPGYMKGDDDDNDNASPDPLSRCLQSKTDYQNIRACPRSPGESLVFTHRLIHWGSAGSKRSQSPPRIAISFVASSLDFESPYLTCGESRPNFLQRLVLICAQLIIYYQRFPSIIDYKHLKLIHSVVENKAQAVGLEEKYRKKVQQEFLMATTELAFQPGNDSEDEEEALAAMLNNDEGDFEDDFVDEEEENENECVSSDDDDDDDDEPAFVIGLPPHKKAKHNN